MIPRSSESKCTVSLPVPRGGPEAGPWDIEPDHRGVEQPGTPWKPFSLGLSPLRETPQNVPDSSIFSAVKYRSQPLSCKPTAYLRDDAGGLAEDLQNPEQCDRVEPCVQSAEKGSR